MPLGTLTSVEFTNFAQPKTRLLASTLGHCHGVGLGCAPGTTSLRRIFRQPLSWTLPVATHSHVEAKIHD